MLFIYVSFHFTRRLNLSVMEKGFPLPATGKGESSIAGQGQPKHLVICFSPLAFAPNPMYYRFESFPMSKLIRGGKDLKRKWSDDGPSSPESPLFGTLEKPEGLFVWCDNDDPSDVSNPRHWGMNFLHVGGGQVYVVGGCAPVDPYDTYVPPLPVATLNKEFRCISLSTHLESATVECKSPLQTNTYNPLIVEIGGLIYVLASPPDLGSFHTEPTGFEVYNPLTDAWTTLPNPEFLEDPHGTLPTGVTGYSSVVIDNKLCVSTTHVSATFDTETKEWGPCNIFSECKLKPLRISSYAQDIWLTPPFPFERNAVFYRNNIFLCVRHVLNGDLGLYAFKITDDKEKAIQMPLHFDDMPKGVRSMDIIGLGGDCFALMTDGRVLNSLERFEIVFVTFKVVSKMMKDEEGEGEVEGLVCEFMKTIYCDATCHAGLGWRNPIYWFTM